MKQTQRFIEADKVTVFDFVEKTLTVYENYRERCEEVRRTDRPWLTDDQVDAILDAWSEEWLATGGMNTLEVVRR